MPSIVLRLFFFFIGIAYASSGHANDTMPVSLTQPDSGSSVVLSQGQILNVSLLAHVDGGYIWEVMPGTESILQHGREQCIPVCSRPHAIGCPAMCTFTFKAIAPGQIPLKLIEHQPWMTGVPPAQTFEVTVTVGAAISVPTLTDWGMVLFALFAGLGSAYYLMRRKMRQP